jgi:hypothetical protein
MESINDLKLIIEAKKLLMRALPYINTHKEKSAPGFGTAADALIKEIESFVFVNKIGNNV